MYGDKYFIVTLPDASRVVAVTYNEGRVKDVVAGTQATAVLGDAEQAKAINNYFQVEHYEAWLLLRNRILEMSAQPKQAVNRDLLSFIDRFQNLKNKTTTTKSSSYEFNIFFEPWSDKVALSWGCYDIPGYPRHYETATTRDELLAHMEAEIIKMEAAVAADYAD